MFSSSWCILKVVLYGSTTVSDTFGEGTTEYVVIIRSGYSSRILLISNVPIPEPISWGLFCRKSHNLKDTKFLVKRFFGLRSPIMCIIRLIFYRTCSASEWVSQLKALQTVAILCLFTNDIHHVIDYFSTFRVVSFRPVISCSVLTKNVVVRTKKL